MAAGEGGRVTSEIASTWCSLGDEGRVDEGTRGRGGRNSAVSLYPAARGAQSRHRAHPTRAPMGPVIRSNAAEEEESSLRRRGDGRNTCLGAPAPP